MGRDRKEVSNAQWMMEKLLYFSSREIGFRCMKLQNPPRVHSLKERKTSHGAVQASNEIPPSLSPHIILSATGLPEVGYRRQLRMNRLSIEPSIIE